MKILSILLLAVSLFLLAGCGPSVRERQEAGCWLDNGDPECQPTYIREWHQRRDQKIAHAKACARLSQPYDSENDICVTPEIQAARDEQNREAAEIEKARADAQTTNSVNDPYHNFLVGCDYGYTTDPNTGVVKCNSKPVDVRVVQ